MFLADFVRFIRSDFLRFDFFFVFVVIFINRFLSSSELLELDEFDDDDDDDEDEFDDEDEEELLALVVTFGFLNDRILFFVFFIFFCFRSFKSLEWRRGCRFIGRFLSNFDT
jgi:hypothetical protein